MSLDDMNPQARARLEDEKIVWLTTVAPNGQPQTSPVWFVVDDGDILVYSMRSARVSNITAHPAVALNLDGDGEGGAIVTMEGTARVDEETPPPDEHGPFLEKYRAKLDGYEWTAAYFAEHYPIPIRVAVSRIRAS